MMKTVIQGIPYVGAGLLLFVSSGTLVWPQAWCFMLVTIVCGLATGAWLKSSNPDLYAERTKSPSRYQERPRDRIIATCVMLGMGVWFVLMAFDAQRFHWSSIPLWLQAVGACLIAMAFIGWISVMRENTYASAEVRVQKERGQTVISTGPYGIVRHPMYAYALLLIVGTAFLLGSAWGLLGLFWLMPLLGARAVAEEDVLRSELPGYAAYASKVRYRLVPGIW
jgi:protein-S-isoprenylcysteine O-methyltransferase Ste14